MKFKLIIVIAVVSLILLIIRVGAQTGTTLISPPWNHCMGLNKVTQFHLNIYSGYRDKFNDPQGLFCTKLLCEDDSSTSYDDDELTVFGLNSGNDELIYNRGLTSINIVGENGRGALQFNKPLDITGDRKGNLYVADTGNNRIVYLRYVDGEVEQSGTMGEEFLKRPSSVSLSGGLIYIADTGNDRIVVLDLSGSLIKIIKPQDRNLKLLSPTAIEVVSKGDEWLYYTDYFIAVIDSIGQRLWRLTHDGTIQKVVKHNLLGSGTFSHLDIDYYGNIYVTDITQDKIHKFDRKLNYLVGIGGSDIELDEPRGIAIYRRFGQIFISERSGAQYFWVGTDIIRFMAENIALEPESGMCSVDISFILTEHSSISLFLEDEKGNELLTILSDYLFPPGHISKRIQLTRPGAQQFERQKIRIVATGKPTYSSHSYCHIVKRSNLLQPSLQTPGK